MRVCRAAQTKAVICLLLLGACDPGHEATAPVDFRAAAKSAAASATVVNDRHVVAFRSAQVPADFAKRVAALGGTVQAAFPAVGAAVVRGLTNAEAQQLAGSKGVLAVEADVLVAQDRLLSSLDGGERAVLASPSDPTSATFFSRQWHLRQVKADAAWDAGRLGSGQVTVALLDTGIDYTHPDLVGRVDLANSVSLLPDEDAVVQQLFPGANPIADLHFHGTHVAATVSSNAIIAAGVTSGLNLMAVKVCFGLDYDGNGQIDGCPLSAIIGGLVHAVTNGADVINMSLGTFLLKKASPGATSIFNHFLHFAQQSGVTLVVATGNESLSLNHIGNFYAIFCDTPGVICVSATGPTSGTLLIDAQNPTGVYINQQNPDAPADYTNFGSAITVAAPGGTPGGLVWAACTQFTQLAGFDICNAQPWRVGAGGTSMATAHVTALAALLVEDLGRRPQQIAARIRQSADDLGKPGSDPFYGSGRINLARALGL